MFAKTNNKRDRKLGVSGVIGRRRLLRDGVVLGGGMLGAALVGCTAAPIGKPADSQPTSTQPAGVAVATARAGVPTIEGKPKSGGTFTLTAGSSFPGEDQHTALSQTIWQFISERAISVDPWTGELVPNIVEKWETPDSTHFVLHVRKGVKLHNRPPWNGREFDAEDLAFNMNRIAGNTAQAENLTKSVFGRADTLAGMQKIEVTDKHTVRVTMAEPSSSFLKGLTVNQNVLMPRGVVEAGFKEPTKFAGLGAYQITEYQSGQRETYTKVPGYYRAGEPYFDKLVRLIVPDRAANIAGFISRQFSLLERPTLQDAQTIKSARPDMLAYVTPGNSCQHIRMNMKFGPFIDFRVRKALQLAIDYAELGESYYGPGWAYVMAFHPNFSESWPTDKVKTLAGYNPDTKAKDREEAQKLLSAAGYANGDRIAFDLALPQGSPNSEAFQANATRFQAQMQALFKAMKVTIKTPDQAAYNKLQSGRDFQAVTYGIVAQPDIASEAYSHLHSKGGRNYGNFENAEADALLQKARVELDPTARKDIFETFQQKYFAEWMPILQLYVPPLKNILQPDIAGFDKVVGPWSGGLYSERIGTLYNV